MPGCALYINRKYFIFEKHVEANNLNQSWNRRHYKNELCKTDRGCIEPLWQILERLDHSEAIYITLLVF